MPVNSVPVGMFQKKVLEVPAQYVDAANDSLKWLVVVLISFAYNKYVGSRYGFNDVPTGNTIQSTMVTASVMALGLFIYHFVVQRVVVFLPKSGQSTYYMALKRM
jgi:hypothetical protein